ncbi:aminotransferase-like domain-containing protein [Aliamphritea hakodatensis]|uniref:aminotransferase-like domain-containing protein n=1 Tax=Aliamphritea hakodatensis TaxID=2895352 RepID=UPI0022FD57CF|nr:PLP-dependent aminotransferase family protein [Aliamphritea hakodatensis]
MWYPENTGVRMGVNELVFAIEEAITRHELKVGDRLPPQRILAYKLEVNPTTVSRAYQRAAQKGLVGGQIGRGTYVLGNSNAAMFAQAIGVSDGLKINLSINKLRCDEVILKLNKQIEAANTLANTPQYYEYISNDLVQRFQRAVSQWLYACRQVTFYGDQILALPSCQYGLQMIFTRLLNAGDAILVDEFTAPGIITAAKQRGLRLFTCKGDEQGITPEGLVSAARQTGARMLVTIPSHHSPLGFSQTEARRRALANEIRRLDLLLVEEDIYGMFDTPAPVSGYIPQHSLLVSGFSKCLSGGHRASFIASANPVLHKLRENIVETAWLVSASAASHIITAIEHGLIDKAIQHCLAEMKRRNSLLNKRLGLQLPLTSPHHWLANTVVDIRGLKAVGVDVAEARHFAVNPLDDPLSHCRLSVNGVDDETYEQGLNLLAGFVQKRVV